MTDVPPEPRRVHQVGPHILKFEPPDVVHIHYNGDVELAHFLAFQELLVTIEDTSRTFLLRDARKGGFVKQEARAYIVRAAKWTKFAALVTYGSSFQSRTVYSLVTTAIHRIRNDDAPAVFFDTEEEARAWISAHRS